MKYIKVKLSTPFPGWPLKRQTPGNSCVWGNCKFYINKDVEECDWWIVFEDLFRSEAVTVPKENTILVTGEPPSIKSYPKKFTDQFGIVITSHKDMDHSNKILKQQGLPWLVGAYYDHNKKWNISKFSKNYDELEKIKVIEKTRLISVVTSDKKITSGHEKRIQFVIKLKKYLGDQIDVFGRGFNEVQDKWDAIAPYKFHIVIENSQFEDYWTEKLSDSFLGLSFPFYYGCPNLSTYFNTQSFVDIDINNFQESLSIIKNGIENIDYPDHLKLLMEAKNKILNDHNLFQIISKEIKNNNINSKDKIQLKLYPQKKISKFKIFKDNIASKVVKHDKH